MANGADSGACCLADGSCSEQSGGVVPPGRSLTSMVNVVDLYALFAEMAGISDVQAEVPRRIDTVSMLLYLENPAQPALRDWNYTEVGLLGASTRG